MSQSTNLNNSTNVDNQNIHHYQPNDIILNHYKIIKEIGHGGMNSVVYLADDLNINPASYDALSNKTVAIKVIDKTQNITEDE